MGIEEVHVKTGEGRTGTDLIVDFFGFLVGDTLFFLFRFCCLWASLVRSSSEISGFSSYSLEVPDSDRSLLIILTMLWIFSIEGLEYGYK